MKLPIAIIIAIILLTLFDGCTCSKETTVTTVTPRDTAITPNPIIDSSLATDNEGIDLLYDFIFALQRENDSLRGVPVRIEYRNTNPLNYQANAYKVNKGDSVWVTFEYKNGKKSFFWKVIPAKLNVVVNDTQTNTVKQYEPTFLEKVWTVIKNFALVISIFVNIILAGFIFLSKVRIPFIN